ncbi:unnamed protein product, partial [Urochloa humidicola]
TRTLLQFLSADDAEAGGKATLLRCPLSQVSSLATYRPHLQFLLPVSLPCFHVSLVLAMGACATKPGDLKVKGEPPLVVEDAAAAVAPLVVSEEKVAANVVVPTAAEADPADASRRRSLSDLLKQDAETGDGETADQESAEKALAVEPATSAAVDNTAGATVGAQSPVQASAETGQDGVVANEPKEDAQGTDVQVVEEEEKRVDPDSVQVVVPAAAAAAAAPSAEESKVVEDGDSA